jgi:hypothetical protein
MWLLPTPTAGRGDPIISRQPAQRGEVADLRSVQ